MHAPAINGTHRAHAALLALDPGCNRDEWIRLSMAAKMAGVDFDDWHAWSASAANYAGEADCRAVWRSLKNGGVGPGTLFAAARSAGWTDDASEHPRFSPPPAPPTPAAARRSGIDPVAFWNACTPAPDSHPYLLRKGMPADGLRIAPEGTRIAGHDCAGWLVVPVWNVEHGGLQSVQLVAPEAGPPKLSLPGHPIKGGMWAVHQDAPEGQPVPAAFADGVAYLAEGAATATSLFQATGHAAIATFGKSNLDAVARALRQQYPDLRLVLVPDRGTEHQAEAIVRSIGGPAAWAALPEDLPANTDANDFASEHGLEELAELLKQERTPPTRFPIISADELAALPPVRWLVRDVLPEEGVAAIYGPPACGKSFLALDLLGAVAAGRSWFGHRATAAPVLYIALEGERGIAQRAKAYEKRHEANLRIHFLPTALDLRQAQDRADLVTAARAAGLAGGVLCIDTLAASAPGLDENASSDMGALISHVKELQAELGGLVLLVHHAGKDATKGLRGHSSLLAALDASIFVTRSDDRREWRVAKSKDGADGEAHPFRLDVVELGTDEYGEAITSCVVVPDERTADVVRRVKLPQGGNQKLVYDAVRELLREASSFGVAGAPPTRPCVELDQAINRARDRLACDPDRKTERTRQAITGLVSSGVLVLREGWLWLA